MNQWQWLIDYCQTHSIRFLPSISGEPWVGYKAVADLLQQEEKTIENAVVRMRIPRHPVFTGLIQITSFEQLGRNASER